MKLILVRHAKAMDQVKALLRSVSDKDRPLTKKGKLKFAEHVKLHRKEFSGTELFVSSEFLRATQTLELLLENLPKLKTKRTQMTVKKITPDDSSDNLIKWLITRTEKKIVVVGHEPFLSKFLKTAKKRQDLKKIKKGAIICTEIDFSNERFAIKVEKVLQPLPVPDEKTKFKKSETSED